MTLHRPGEELAGHGALVVGGGRNLGRAVSLELARLGADVAVAVRASESEAQRVAGEVEALGRRSLAVVGDVSDSGEVARMVAEVRRSIGPVTILVYAAVERMRAALAEITDEDWGRSLATNLSGAFFCIRAVLEDMRVRGFGRVVAVTGLRAGSPVPGPRAPHAHVAAAKAGLDGLIRELAVELGPLGITCNAVAPGPIETSRTLPVTLWDTAVGRSGVPDDVAYACAALCSPRAAFINGQVLVVDGGGPARADAQPADR